MPKRSSKDVNQIAASIVDAVTRAAEETPSKNPAAVALGRKGGSQPLLTLRQRQLKRLLPPSS